MRDAKIIQEKQLIHFRDALRQEFPGSLSTLRFVQGSWNHWTCTIYNVLRAPSMANFFRVQTTDAIEVAVSFLHFQSLV